MRRVFAAALLLLGACSIAPPATPAPTLYDFGPAPEVAAPPRAPGTLHVGAPSWLDTGAMLYRLDYRDTAQIAAYRDSRWAAAPAALLAERLRHQAARAGERARTVALRVELEEFCQAFAAPDRSRAVLRLRAALVDTASGQLLRQRAFAFEQDAASADAAGGAHALALAADRAVGELLAWAVAP